MQVAISVVAAAMWMIQNPEQGVLRARRSAARVRAGYRPAILGRVAVDSLRLDAA